VLFYKRRFPVSKAKQRPVSRFKFRVSKSKTTAKVKSPHRGDVEAERNSIGESKSLPQGLKPDPVTTLRTAKAVLFYKDPRPCSSSTSRSGILQVAKRKILRARKKALWMTKGGF
jgi:hypothetical protein